MSNEQRGNLVVGEIEISRGSIASPGAAVVVLDLDYRTVARRDNPTIEP
ncbi:MAG TPA: hypothetical protein VGM54_07415 [Chthoniobacter sp.]|jgi:hypothetical protein